MTINTKIKIMCQFLCQLYKWIWELFLLFAIISIFSQLNRNKIQRIFHVECRYLECIPYGKIIYIKEHTFLLISWNICNQRETNKEQSYVDPWLKLKPLHGVLMRTMKSRYIVNLFQYFLFLKIISKLSCCFLTLSLSIELLWILFSCYFRAVVLFQYI